MASNDSITRLGQDENFNLQLARGQIYNHSHVYKFGSNATVGTTEATIWLQEGVYTWPSGAAALDVTSTDDTNDKAGGTGALTVTLEGLDANYDEISETVTMTGYTAAVTTKTFLRLHRMFVATAGSTDTNQGVIYASTGAQTNGVPDVDSTIRSTIGATKGQTLQAFYTVPAGYTAYVQNVTAGSSDGTNATTISFYKRPEGGAFRVQDEFIVFKSTTGIPHDVPIEFVEKTDLELRGTAALATTDVAGSFDIILVKN